MFNEDMFGYTQVRGRTSSSTRRSSERSTDRDRLPDVDSRDNIFRWRDRQYFGPKRWLESALRDPAWQDKVLSIANHSYALQRPNTKAIMTKAPTAKV